MAEKKPAGKPAAGGKTGGHPTVHKMYKVGEKAERLKKTCPKCGPGMFMAQHKDRTTCGKCHYTEFQKK
jgi:small subunit ribosomal protein S27Ae